MPKSQKPRKKRDTKARPISSKAELIKQLNAAVAELILNRKA